MADENDAWRIVADTVCRMIAGELSFLRGAQMVLAHQRDAQIPEDDPDLAAFALIASETDHLPIGDQSTYWASEALKERESDLGRAEEWARCAAESAAHDLLARFVRRVGSTDVAATERLLRRRVFFSTYSERIPARLPSLLLYGLRVPCPCCGYPTLIGRADYEICFVCWWQDDGQDDAVASQVYGGPNGLYSLAEARANFDRCYAMCPPVADQHPLDSQGAYDLKMAVINAFEKMMATAPSQHAMLWNSVFRGELEIEQVLRDDSSSSSL